MLKTRVSISGTRQGEPTHPLKVKSDQKDGSKTYKTQIETELMVMITSQGAREGASQARFLRALQRSQADGNGEMKTLNRSDNKSLKPGREVQHFPFNKKTISRKRLPRNGHRAVHCSPQQIPHLHKDVHPMLRLQNESRKRNLATSMGRRSQRVGCAQM